MHPNLKLNIYDCYEISSELTALLNSAVEEINNNKDYRACFDRACINLLRLQQQMQQTASAIMNNR